MLGNVTRHSLDMNWLTFSLGMKSFTVKNLSDYENGKRFMSEHVTHLNTISENKGSDTTISERINVLWK